MMQQISLLGDEIVRFSRTMNLVRQHFENAEHELSLPLQVALRHIVEGSGVRACALKDVGNIDKSTASRQADQLVKLGLVTREPNPNDGRSTVLVATDAGRARIDTATQHRNAIVANIVSDWDDENIAALAMLLNRLNTAINDQIENVLTAVTAASKENV